MGEVGDPECVAGIPSKYDRPDYRKCNLDLPQCSCSFAQKSESQAGADFDTAAIRSLNELPVVAIGQPGYCVVPANCGFETGAMAPEADHRLP